MPSNPHELTVNIPRQKINGDRSGVKQLCNVPGVGGDYVEFALKPDGDFHRPHILDSEIFTRMAIRVKISESKI